MGMILNKLDSCLVTLQEKTTLDPFSQDKAIFTQGTQSPDIFSTCWDYDGRCPTIDAKTAFDRGLLPPAARKALRHALGSRSVCFQIQTLFGVWPGAWLVALGCQELRVGRMSNI